MTTTRLLGALAAIMVLAACGGDDGGTGQAGYGGGMMGGAGGAGAAGGGFAGVGFGGSGVGGTAGVAGAAGAAGAGAGGTGGSAPACGPADTWSACAMGNPGGPPAPPIPGYSGGACPPIQAWSTATKPYNMIAGGRSFIFVQPARPCPGERFPLVFLWHWISGEARDWLGGEALQMAADQYRVAFAIPEAKGATVFGQDTQWPFDVTQPQPRMEEEFVFFDDMLSCVSQQYPINNDCVG
jgi:hypothetical protein